MWPFAKRYPVLKQIVAHTTTEKSFRGLLWDRRAGYLILRSAELLDGAKPLALPGDVLIPDDAIEFLQVIE